MCSIFLYITLLQIFYPINMQNSSCKHAFSMNVENSVDLDQMSSSVAS